MWAHLGAVGNLAVFTVLIAGPGWAVSHWRIECRSPFLVAVGIANVVLSPGCRHGVRNGTPVTLPRRWCYERVLEAGLAQSGPGAAHELALRVLVFPPGCRIAIVTTRSLRGRTIGRSTAVVGNRMRGTSARIRKPNGGMAPSYARDDSGW